MGEHGRAWVSMGEHGQIPGLGLNPRGSALWQFQPGNQRTLPFTHLPLTLTARLEDHGLTPWSIWSGKIKPIWTSFTSPRKPVAGFRFLLPTVTPFPHNLYYFIGK